MRFWKQKTPEDILSGLRSVHELDRYGGFTSAQKVRLKNETGILLVDDADADLLMRVLGKYDFKNVYPCSSRPSDELVAKYPIVITDVCGIGADLNSNGLLFAEHIKDTYPLKQVVVISEQVQSREYKKDAEVIKKVDGVFRKSASYDELAKILDPCICRVNDPAYVWRRIRDELLCCRGDVKKDAQIAQVAIWEDQYVRQFMQSGRGEGGGDSVRGDWVDAMIKAVGLASQVVDLLSGIKAIFPTGA